MNTTVNEEVKKETTSVEPKVMYQVVTTRGAELLTYAELAEKYEIIGINQNTHNRIEIQGKPKLADYHGPMYNGVNKDGQLVVRYESYKAYEMYSR